MIKKGFTLAEVLITLGIIGVVAALTLPSLTHNVGERQIGPKLFNAVSVLENANQALLGSEFDRLDTMPQMLDNNNNINLEGYIGHLRGVIKMSSANVDDGSFTTKSGIIYTVVNTAPQASNNNLPGEERIAEIRINISGDSERAQDGTDVFHFSLMNDGTLIPQGAAGWRGNRVPETDNDATDGWRSNCANNNIPTNRQFCAGSIFANGGRVLYK